MNMGGDIMELAERTPLSPFRLPVDLCTGLFAVAIAAAIEKEGLYGMINEMTMTSKLVLFSVPGLCEHALKRPAKAMV